MKKNIPLLLVWVFFVAAILGGIGPVYGVHLLFLDPEYLGKVGVLSFFIVGLSLGNFIMAFQIASYILNGHHFSFLGILERPFSKYVINNSLVPILSLLIYVIAILKFQLVDNDAGVGQAITSVMGLIAGVVIMVLLMFTYFRWTNNDIFKYLSGSVDKRLRKSVISRSRVMDRLRESRAHDYPVLTYLDLKLKVRSSANLRDFYDKKAVLKVFDQNHFNSVLLELAIIVIVLLLGVFMEYPVVQIPAAASVLLLFTILLMALGAVSFWFRSWGVAVVIGLLLTFNFLTKTGVIGDHSMARGLRYDLQPIEYNLEEIALDQQRYQASLGQSIKRLENWKARQTDSLPKMNLLCVSGGGQRAAYWTMNTLLGISGRYGDQLFEHTALITGASGGMVGAAYYRELYLAKMFSGEPDSIFLANIGKDNLNAIIYSLVVNDVFFKLRNLKYQERTYAFDRGQMFEQRLNTNLDGLLDKNVSSYREAENSGQIPSMILAPVIANDGRKLYISASDVSYMTALSQIDDQKIRGVDFQSMFDTLGGENLHMLTALRMSASFPYITPTIGLPSKPKMEIMDAGISDNFGISDALHFVSVHRDWIESNTSGVVLTVIRDTHKLTPIEARSNPSLTDRFTNPIANVYNNLSNMQDIQNDNLLAVTRSWLEVPIDLVSFEYDNDRSGRAFASESHRLQQEVVDRASLSWHLTEKEKRTIRVNLQKSTNQASMTRLGQLLNLQ